jgi:hypothetical protein
VFAADSEKISEDSPDALGTSGVQVIQRQEIGEPAVQKHFHERSPAKFAVLLSNLAIVRTQVLR